ncbi:VCBS repeat protein [Idiomarina aquatica]|uniref:VCBS repeat protein n=1 Tax=Idiomarina aquatica TaxID=1327752 RepID=A0A4V3CQ74_9GAMM|nr:VCBS repeat-containing protein [Idiomarina aquatica]TDP40200.1 VCBS repeat protein [Idiomarina aquatica]
MKFNRISLAVFTTFALSACGGGSGSDNSPSSSTPPPPEPVALESINDIEATETTQTSLTINWSSDDEFDVTVTQSSGPEIGLSQQDNVITLTLPEVTTDVSADFSVSLRKDDEELDSTSFNVLIKNDNSRLYADGYSGLRLNQEAVHETDTWRAAQVGLYVYDLEHFDTPRSNCYPTRDNCNEFDSFQMMVGDNVRGDFNNDGLEDLAVSISFSPHRAERDLDRFPGTVHIYTGHPEKGLVLNNDVIVDHASLKRHQPYRMTVADFNGDGADDIVVSGGAIPASEEQQAEGILFIREERPIMLLSNGEGRLVDASDNVDITVGDGSSAFGHNLAVGDVNNDSFMDFFTGTSVVLNNGDGTFTEQSDRYFSAWSQWSSALASAMGDMNDDGLTDLAILDYTVLQDGDLARSQVILSNNPGDSLAMSNSPRAQLLPEGYWGDDITHTNYALMADFVPEHPGDELIVAQTRLDKYYDGRYLRLFAINADGDFIEETERLINNEQRIGQRADSNGDGEGTFYFIDFDKDGHKDIVDITGGESNCDDLALCAPGFSVFYGDGDGNYVYRRLENVPYFMYNDLAGYNDGSSRSRTLKTAMPWDSGNPTGYDLLTWFGTLPQEYMQQGDEQVNIWYLLEQKENGL